MTVLFTTHPQFLDHVTGRGHPERPERLRGGRGGDRRRPGSADALVHFEPRAATSAEVARVHPEPFLDQLAEFTLGGGGHIDPDTVAVPASYAAALLAAGSGLEPPSTTSTPARATWRSAPSARPGTTPRRRRSMGFCLVNNVAVTARALADRGERVLIVDYDAHHGNGTQDVFYDDPSVVYVSFHEYPLYPGTGGVPEMGDGDGYGTTVNFPFPAGATGDVYRAALDAVVLPLVDRWQPTWLLVSAGFDGHRRDPDHRARSERR